MKFSHPDYASKLIIYHLIFHSLLLLNILYFSFHRSNDGLKSFDKLRQEKDRENSKLNKIERKQDKMLFVAFYILLNLVSKWAKIVETFSWH